MLDFRRLRGGADGQRGSFERLLRHLAEVIPPAGATEFRPIEGAGGDGGVEAYWVIEDGTEEGYQAKFHEEAGDINWTALNSSITTAISTHPAMTRITVGMPCDLTVRGEATEVLSTLIESVTIYPEGEHGPEAEVVAKVADLLGWATNDNAAPRGGVCSSMVLVAGTGFEPVTFRL